MEIGGLGVFQVIPQHHLTTCELKKSQETNGPTMQKRMIAGGEKRGEDPRCGILGVPDRGAAQLPDV